MTTVLLTCTELDGRILKTRRLHSDINIPELETKLTFEKRISLAFYEMKSEFPVSYIFTNRYPDIIVPAGEPSQATNVTQFNAPTIKRKRRNNAHAQTE